ncbi:DUF6750 family protein [Klebsiella aerogenes]
MRNFILSVSTRTWMFKHSVSRKINMSMAGAFTAAMTPAVRADDDLFGMFDHVAEGADNSTDGWQKLAKFGGWGFCFAGLILMIAKKKNPQIGWGWIGTFWAVGFCLIALDQFIKKGQSTIDLNPTT